MPKLPPFNVRYIILLMLFIATTINYADRATIAIAGADIQSDLGISSITLGYIFSAFGWAYVLGQIPGGWLLDRFGSRKVYAFSIFFWSLFTLIQGFIDQFSVASAIPFLFILRFMVGLSEAPSFPGNARIVAAWFPTAERGRASAVFNSAQYFATALFAPLLGWIVYSFGWQSVFFIMGVIGIVFSLVWLKLIYAPNEHPMITEEEFRYIEANGALVDMDAGMGVQRSERSNVGSSEVGVQDKAKADNNNAEVGVHDKRNHAGGREAQWGLIRQLLTTRMLIGVYIGQYGINSITYFFLTWFPVYLVQEKGMTILKAGFVASLPAICGFLGGILGGFLSDYLLKKGFSLTAARKIPIIFGLSLSMTMFACNYVDQDWFIVAIMALAFFGKGLGALGWAVVSDTSPKQIAGLSGGLFNTFGNLASITTPIVIGYIINKTGSFEWALIYVAANALLAVVSYLFIVGKIQRVELNTETDINSSNGGVKAHDLN